MNADMNPVLSALIGVDRRLIGFFEVFMKIELTESAAKQSQKQIAQRGKGLGLRVGVKDAGCSGFAYVYDYADEVRADDKLFEAHDAKVVVDAKSLETLDGSTLDFVKEGLKQVFKFTNPNVDATCGCGESFSGQEETLRGTSQS